ncbi:GNAT family N-acetyltransferase [Natronorubrum sp. FCH18a]|uniref:GNAT family N-acetyltransferase n=1 Tax=Natronorubrum sp. FCH18a TaxID=3447018 RepID=UPI003F5108FC
MTTCDDCRLPTEAKQAHDGDETRTLCKPCATLVDSDRSIYVSPLEHDDLELILAWRSNPKVYRHFRLQDGPLDWDEHVAWFESRGPDRHDFVIHYDGRRVGVVSIDGENEVGIYLGDFSAHSHGVATMALNWLCNRFNERTPLTAEIHEQNGASKQLFTRCGFQQESIDNEWLQYVYDP